MAIKAFKLDNKGEVINVIKIEEGDDPSLYDRTGVPGVWVLDTGNGTPYSNDELTERETKRQHWENFFSSLDYNQVDTYIDNNVNSLAEAKAFLKLLSKALLSRFK